MALTLGLLILDGRSVHVRLEWAVKSEASDEREGGRGLAITEDPSLTEDSATT